MRRPDPKPGNRLIPENLALILPMLYQGWFENKNFQESPPVCPKCKSQIKPFDRVRRVYMRILTLEGIPRNIYVNVRRFRCSNGHITMANDAFYPNCRYGKRIVDLILYLGATRPFNSVEKDLSDLRIQVDRDTVRNYFKRFGARSAQLAGIKVFDKDQAVNVLKLLFGMETIEALRKRYPGLKLSTQADETYPAKKGALSQFRQTLVKCRQKGEECPDYPEAFTVGMRLSPEINIVTSLSVHPWPITDIQGMALRYPITGSDYTLTDGSGLYARWPNRVPDLFHEARNMFTEFREGLPEGQPLNEDLMNGFKEQFRKHKERRVRTLSTLYPQYVNDRNEFTGRLGAGAGEGLASRMKYFMGVPYKTISSFLGRIVAYAIVDSLYTFRRGKSSKSFAHSRSTFKWEDVMDCPENVKDPLLKMFRGWYPEKFQRFGGG
ncbi:MAG: hypothetical protein QW379_04525 [Thermoplasmata archaeon]